MDTKAMSIFHQNLRSSCTITNEIKQSTFSFTPDLLLIQEPYCIKNKVIFNMQSQILYCNQAKPDTAIVVLNSRINAKLIPSFSNSFCTTISVRTTTNPIIIANFYIRPGKFDNTHSAFI